MSNREQDEALEAARRIVAENARQSSPMVTARLIQLPTDALIVARALLASRDAVLTEREECAKVADGFTDEEDGDIAYDIAAAIRSRTP